MILPLLSLHVARYGHRNPSRPKVMNVPYVDLNAQHSPIRDELLHAIGEVIDASAFSGGSFVRNFEERFATHCGTSHAVGVASGTDALWLALSALGVGPGDEVITVPMTFFATAEAISRTGATPVFVDIEETTYTMKPVELARAISPRTKAILPVHLFGQMADMNPILEIARKHRIAVVEDASQAHGASYHGSHAGSMGHAGCFSFYPGKNLGALGEAGAVVTGDPELAERIRELRDHGQITKHHHAFIGWNARMDGIHAAVLMLKLRDLELNNRRRRKHAALYSRELQGMPGVKLPHTAPGRTHVHHIYAIRVACRDAFASHLKSRGIGYAIHYPTPVHLQPAYSHLGLKRGSCPVSERCADEFISLPMFPELSSASLKAVVRAIAEFVTPEAAISSVTGHRSPYHTPR
jgi:dTDP-4-amino-4,6-dideoxygalactose transaminase